ncbi:MAG: Ig-like domain-containing protein, partial [Myxococcota bacterium]
RQQRSSEDQYFRPVGVRTGLCYMFAPMEPHVSPRAAGTGRRGQHAVMPISEAQSPLGSPTTALVITPVAPLLPATAYELRVEPGITDIFAMPLAGEPRLFSFTSQ